MRRVIIETPFAATDTAKQLDNILYARQCCRDAVARGEVPFASHLFFPQFLNDSDPQERETGVTLGYDFWERSDCVVFYLDRGMSPGMAAALSEAFMRDVPVERRYLRIAVDHEVRTPKPGPEAYAPKPKELQAKENPLDRMMAALQVQPQETAASAQGENGDPQK